MDEVENVCVIMEENETDSTCRPESEMVSTLKYIEQVSYEWISECAAACSHIAKIMKENVAVVGIKAKEHFTRSLKSFESQGWWSVEWLFYTALLVVIISAMIVILLNTYRKIRYAIPATVNCWFCNTNTKVLYSLRDTWTCPNCQQYNGFSSDGGYNKRIPAHFIEALNRPIRGGPPVGHQLRKGGANSNGLCSQCNLNQVLKVFQLSSFVPVNERNYDAEIEAEQKRLEQLYDICHQCKIVVEQTLKRTPDKQQLPVKRNVQVNKVVPNPPMTVAEALNNKVSIPNYANHKERSLLQDISSASENDSDESYLSLDNLNIDSKGLLVNESYEEFQMPIRSSSSRPTSPTSPVAGCSMSFYGNNKSPSPGYGMVSNGNGNKNMHPLWKDYPMINAGISPTYSIVDTMSCPVGRPAYVAYNSSVNSQRVSPVQFNYQSSNMGSVFGGQKPVISPPKFSNNNSHPFAPHIRFGAYYDVTSSPSPFLNAPMPVMFSPHYFTNPISRSSSQSSGFVSQQGGVVTSQPHTATSTGFYMTTS